MYFCLNTGESQVTNFDQVCKLCRQTGFIANDAKATPKTYPQEYFARIKLDSDLLSMVINRLSSDDIYLQTRTFPGTLYSSGTIAVDTSSISYIGSFFLFFLFFARLLLLF